jgi:hypothetical protein
VLQTHQEQLANIILEEMQQSELEALDLQNMNTDNTRTKER